MVYRCQACTNQSGLYPDVRQMISELKEDIQKLNNLCTTVDDLKTQYEVTKQEVEDLKIAHQSIEVMQSQITTMESDINSLKSIVATVSTSGGDVSPANLEKSMISNLTHWHLRSRIVFVGQQILHYTKYQSTNKWMTLRTMHPKYRMIDRVAIMILDMYRAS